MSFSGQALQSIRPVLPPSMLNSSTARLNEFDAPPELEAVGSVVSFARNETIFDEGEEITASYKVMSGVVRLCRLTEDGRRQIAGFRLPGDLIGMEWTGEYEMTAEAVRDVTAVRYARTRLDRLSEERPSVRDHVLAHLRQDLRAAQEHLIMLGCQSATERVAAFLLQLARRAGARDGEDIDMQLGRQDIADYLGLTLETVSRTFSEMTARGFIASPKRRHVVIKNMPKLKACMRSAN
jgi:CRP/FNR family nitrogen fixation transcriptional regulator